MPEPDYTIRQGDSTLAITATLEDADGTAVNISGATVRFHMAPIAGGTVTVNTTATNLDDGPENRGQVSYSLSSTDTSLPGWYVAEWQVTYTTGAVQTFPNVDNTYVLITEQIT